jgi:hypothetical protein
MLLLSYIDSNSGSLVAQVAVAGFAGAAVVVKLGWRRATDRLRGSRGHGTPDASEGAETRDS